MERAVQLSVLALAALIEQALAVLLASVVPSLRQCSERLRRAANHEPLRPNFVHDLGVRHTCLNRMFGFSELAVPCLR